MFTGRNKPDQLNNLSKQHVMNFMLQLQKLSKFQERKCGKERVLSKTREESKPGHLIKFVF